MGAVAKERIGWFRFSVMDAKNNMATMLPELKHLTASCCVIVSITKASMNANEQRLADLALDCAEDVLSVTDSLEIIEQLCDAPYWSQCHTKRRERIRLLAKEALKKLRAVVLQPGMNPHNEAQDPRTAKGN